MNHSEIEPGKRDFFALAFSRRVVIRALKVAAVVGTILALINHGDKIVVGALAGQNVIKIILTYLVPYSVSVWSSVRTIQSAGAGQRV